MVYFYFSAAFSKQNKNKNSFDYLHPLISTLLFFSWYHFNQDFTNTTLQNMLLCHQQPLCHPIQCSILSLHVTLSSLLHFLYLALRTHSCGPLLTSLVVSSVSLPGFPSFLQPLISGASVFSHQIIYLFY